MGLFYNIGILLYTASIYFVSIFNRKARLMVEGRRGWKKRLLAAIKPDDRYIWVHCASLGEFEQGRPVIEEIRTSHPEYKILITFFSPSGFEVRKNYPGADIICYLPSDTPTNAKKFIELVHPEIAIIVKYEFWRNLIYAAHRNGTKLYLISAIFREHQHFFKGYGTFFAKMLEKFDTIFVQDSDSASLLKTISVKNVVVAGDTRFDRVVRIAAEARDIPKLESFRGDEKLFLCGSSWHGDETIIARYINNEPFKMKWVFAPHEISHTNIERLAGLFKIPVARFSTYTDEQKDFRVMIIDNIGLLSSAYRYATIAAIGGGFGKGIHNILEAACWGVPVMFGPNHSKFREAVELKEVGGAVSFSDYEEFRVLADRWIDNLPAYNAASGAAGEYIKNNTGATKTIVDYIFNRA